MKTCNIFLILILFLFATEGMTAQGMNSMDVNNDGAVTPVDSLLITNYLNKHGSGVQVSQGAPRRYDVNNDGVVTPVDALLINNFLNQQGEGTQHNQSGPAIQKQLRTKQPGQDISPTKVPRQLR